MPLTNGSGFGSGSGSWVLILDPDPAIFVIDLKDASKKNHNFFCLLLFEATFTSFFEATFKSFFKDKKSKRVTK
jgi:hypothetical protein